ncbi:unnamed protein product [Parascedosporium putredinis]|uniref:Glucose-6-phosphate 1-epimerase n=1 Tax=Parascedosporium putredinis TaxID=1442378 RepID=A0A9P1HAR1_9PEZI|nr:unnamed protein product [Parascedosporium putredinis]CAI8002340.1 unnamed protein product [Parascedosporium putredinis]
MDRPNKPAALASTPGLPPQAQVTTSHNNERVSAVLPTGDSVEVLLHGATVISWKDASGAEKLWVSDAAKLDGSKPHGFARNAKWDFLGKSTSESTEGSSSSDGSVKLDFGLSSGTLGDDWKAKWGYSFGLVYSVTLSPGNLTTTLVVSNEGEEAFEFQALLHTYLRISDIASTEVVGLENSSFLDKVDGPKTKTQSGAIKITGETDRVYNPETSPKDAVRVVESGKSTVSLVRDNLPDVVPKDGWKTMICVEAGIVRSWTKLEKGDVFEGGQTLSAN